MNSQDALKWNQLILSAIDGSISPDDFARLDDGIRINPELAAHYAEFMLLYSALRQPGQVSTFFTETCAKSDSNLDMELWNEMAAIEKTAETVEVIVPSPAVGLPKAKLPVKQVERKVSRVAVYTSIISLAALIVMGVFVFLNPRTADSAVGVLTKTDHVKWHENSGLFQVGQDLHKGALNLESGLAQIRFDSGAAVVIQGPARIELQSENSMKLLRGKIVATVGRDAIGFVVNTPQGKVLDLGTEFGIQVTDAGQSLVHVFTGEVLLYPSAGQGHVKASQGDAKSITQDGRVSDVPFRAADFIGQEEMDARLLAQSGDSYARWKSFMFELHRDPSLAAHYFDAKEDAQSKSLVNTVSQIKGLADGQFGAQGRTCPTWAQGRWPQKAAVRFERGKKQAIVIPASPGMPLDGPVTISTWVYFPDESRYGGHLISCRDADSINFQFSVFDSHYKYESQEGRFEFLRLKQKEKGSSYSRIFNPQAGTWHHLAVTHDMQKVCFYVDGHLFDAKSDSQRPKAKATEIVLGAMKLDGKYTLQEGDFEGVVDELLVFNRSLGSDEIEKIYTHGLPVSN